MYKSQIKKSPSRSPWRTFTSSPAWESIWSVYWSPTRHSIVESKYTDEPIRKSTLRPFEEIELVESLKELIDYERNLENLKEHLA